MPSHLRDAHYGGAKKLGHGAGYAYSHDAPYGIAEQQYAPDVVLDARVLPADVLGRGGRGQGALGADPEADPGRRGVARPCLWLRGLDDARWRSLLDHRWRVGFRLMQDVSVPVWAVAAAAVGLLLITAALVAVLVRGRRRIARRLDAAHAEAEALRVQVEEIQRSVSAPPALRDEREYVDHRSRSGWWSRARRSPLGTSTSVDTVPAPLFADIVLRETVVQAAALAAGLRRALSPESRNRIRFEMRREVKRARKQRRADLREARREWEARQRAQVDLDEDSAA